MRVPYHLSCLFWKDLEITRFKPLNSFFIDIPDNSYGVLHKFIAFKPPYHLQYSLYGFLQYLNLHEQLVHQVVNCTQLRRNYRVDKIDDVPIYQKLLIGNFTEFSDVYESEFSDSVECNKRALYLYSTQDINPNHFN